MALVGPRHERSGNLHKRRLESMHETGERDILHLEALAGAKGSIVLSS